MTLVVISGHKIKISNSILEVMPSKAGPQPMIFEIRESSSLIWGITFWSDWIGRRDRHFTYIYLINQRWKMLIFEIFSILWYILEAIIKSAMIYRIFWCNFFFEIRSWIFRYFGRKIDFCYSVLYLLHSTSWAMWGEC